MYNRTKIKPLVFIIIVALLLLGCHKILWSTFGIFLAGSHSLGQDYKLSMSVTEWDAAVRQLKQTHPEYEVITDSHYPPDSGKFGTMDDSLPKLTNHLYYRYLFHFPDIQITISCQVPVRSDSVVTLAGILESPGYILRVTDYEYVNGEHINKKANEAVKRKFEREILNRIGDWQRILDKTGDILLPVKSKPWNSKFTKKFVRGMKRNGANIPDSVSWQTVHLPSIIGIDYDTLYLFTNSYDREIGKILGISYEKFWSSENYLLVLKKENRMVYCKEFSRFPYFENVYFRFHVPNRLEEKPICLFRSGNPYYRVRAEKLGDEVFYLLCDPSDSTMFTTEKHVWNH